MKTSQPSAGTNATTNARTMITGGTLPPHASATAHGPQLRVGTFVRGSGQHKVSALTLCIDGARARFESPTSLRAKALDTQRDRVRRTRWPPQVLLRGVPTRSHRRARPAAPF